ncbi:MAG: hypothetical protein ACRYFA_01150 [Janthinobacterium lividum]
MRYFFTLVLFLISKSIFAQQVHTVFRNLKDSSENFYVVRTPKYPIKGLLVLNDRALSDSAKKKAYDMGICTITVVPTSNYLQNLTSNSLLVTIDEMINETITKYKIQKNKIVIGGMSVAGTGAIRYVQHCFTNKSVDCIKPIAVFAIDPPLDYERLWNEAENSVKRNFSKDAVDEGNILMKVLKETMHGTPKTNINSYRLNSPFCYSDSSNHNVALLKNVAVRLYVEPDIIWWIKNRRKDYHDINAIDNAALINQLNLAGNVNAELITSINKGYQEDGTRHPHSWSILNEIELLIWCEKMFKEVK